MNHYITLNHQTSNNNNYLHENSKINNINNYTSNDTMTYINKYDNNNKSINAYKINSLSTQKNLKQMLNGIKDGIEEISNQMKNTDDKIENYIKKNYINNKPSKKNMSTSIKMSLPRPRSQHKKKILSINNSIMSNITNNNIKKYNNKSPNISNITYQYEYSNNNITNSNNRSKLYEKQANNSTNNISSHKNKINNNINNLNFNNNIFSKSSNNFNNKNLLNLSQYKLKNEKEKTLKNLNLSFTEDNTYNNNSINDKYIYKTKTKCHKPKEIYLLNEVLQKQIIEVRLELYDANKKIEELSEMVKNIRIEKKNLIEEKKIYESKLKELTEEFNYDKNYNLNEIESQNQIITKMDMEITQLNNIINEKDDLIQNLKAQINLMFNINNFENNAENNISDSNTKIINNVYNMNNINGNNNNNKYNNYSISKFNNIKNFKTKKDIDNLKEEFEKLINNSNKNTNSYNITYEENNRNNNYSNNNGKSINISSFDLKDVQNKIQLLNEENNILKNENNNLKKELEKYNTINSNNQNYNKIKVLIKENQEIKDSYNKLKTEYEKIIKVNEEVIKIKNENDTFQKKIKEQKDSIDQLNKINGDINVKLLEYETEKQQNKILIKKEKNEFISLKDDNNKLSKINQQLNNINNALKINNEELINEKKNNITKINELLSLNEKLKKEKNNNLNKNKTDKDVEKTIKELNIKINELTNKLKNLEENKTHLEKKLLTYENKEREMREKKIVTDDNIERQVPEDESTILKNEILSLKKQIKELENENHNNIITNSKLKETEEQLNSIKKENDINFNELKNQQNKNKELLDIIKNKEDEIKQLKSSNKNKISQNSINIEGDEEYEEDSEGEQGQYIGEGEKVKNKKNIIIELKKELKIKENIIIEKEKEINEFKLINNQLIQDNTVKQEKIEELMVNSQQESFLLTLDNLKQEIKEHKKTISDLSNKNKELNNLLKSSNIPNSNKYIKKNKFEKAKLDIGDEFENNNNYHSENRPDNNRLSRISGITTTSAGLTDNEKIIKYKSKIKEYKEQINSDLIQMNALKEEIKKLNHKLKHPIFENFEKFLNLFDIAFSDYKPSKKEQKEAFEEINQKFMINNIINI